MALHSAIFIILQDEKIYRYEKSLHMVPVGLDGGDCRLGAVRGTKESLGKKELPERDCRFLYGLPVRGEGGV